MTFFDLFCKQIVNEKTAACGGRRRGLFGVFHKIVPGLLDIVLNFGLQLLGEANLRSGRRRRQNSTRMVLS